MTMLVRPSQDLSDRTNGQLAEMAVSEYAHLLEHLSGAIQRGIALGEIILEVRSRMEYQEWSKWLKDTLNIGSTTGTNFARLAKYSDRLPPEIFQPKKGRDGRTIQPSISNAVRYLQSISMPALGPGGTRRKIDPKIDLEVKRLRDTGMLQREISDLLGISQQMVSLLLQSKEDRTIVNKRSRQLASQRRQERRRLKQFRKMEETAVLAREAGGAISEAYSLIRRLAQKIETAKSQEPEVYLKNILQRSLLQVYRAEDELSQVLRSSYQEAAPTTNHER